MVEYPANANYFHAGLGILPVVDGSALAIGKIVPATGLVIGLIAGAAIAIRRKHARRKIRITYLRNKYSKEKDVQRILRHEFWKGQTVEQLFDSLGSPIGLDQGEGKHRKKELWRYGRRGVSRPSVQIIVNDGVVTGWEPGRR